MCCAQRAVQGMRACASQDGGHDDNMTMMRLQLSRRRRRHVAVACAKACGPCSKGGMRMRCVPSGRGDDDNVAIRWR
jgi:hypothetical protein